MLHGFKQLAKAEQKFILQVIWQLQKREKNLLVSECRCLHSFAGIGKKYSQVTPWLIE